MKNNTLNPKAGQIYKYYDSAFFKLICPCKVNPNPVYNKDLSMNYWDADWYEYHEGKLVKSEKLQRIRMDGFGSPELIDELPNDKPFFLRHVSAGGCDGGRYSTSQIILTKSNMVVGICSLNENSRDWIRLWGITYDINLEQLAFFM